MRQPAGLRSRVEAGRRKLGNLLRDRSALGLPAGKAAVQQAGPRVARVLQRPPDPALNDISHNPIIESNDKISFITLNFTGTGNNKIDIIATETFAGVQKNSEIIDDLTNDVVVDNGGCLIATATYGSEMAPQVQQLRELRDNTLLKSESGTAFMGMFNDVYYSFSPVISDLERENPLFKETVKLFITPMISSLSLLNYVEMDSEESVLGYGISLIILNLAMYVGIPASVIIGIKKKF